jgi:hypothetical protein
VNGEGVATVIAAAVFAAFCVWKGAASWLGRGQEEEAVQTDEPVKIRLPRRGCCCGPTQECGLCPRHGRLPYMHVVRWQEHYDEALRTTPTPREPAL